MRTTSTTCQWWPTHTRHLGETRRRILFLCRHCHASSSIPHAALMDVYLRKEDPKAFWRRWRGSVAPAARRERGDEVVAESYRRVLRLCLLFLVRIKRRRPNPSCRRAPSLPHCPPSKPS